MPKTEKKQTSKKTVSSSMKVEKMPEPVMTSPTNSVLMRLSQQFNLLAILIVALFLFQAYTFYKLKSLETKGVTAAAGAPAGQQDSPLTQDKLIAYAEELKMDKGKFQKCIESGENKDALAADMKQASELGVQGTPGFFINGRFLGGAFPFEAFKEIIDKELAGEPASECTDYSESMQQYCSDPNNPGFVPQAKDIAIGNAPVRGGTDAKVTIVEFSDFECPFCIRAYPTVKQIEDTYGDKVRIVYKQLPLTNLHPHAEGAALASMCANKQGKFWEFHDKLFSLETSG